MSNYMTRAFATHEIIYQRQVLFDTYGHLYPKLGSKQNGWIEWSVSAFGDTNIINFSFKGLESSPVLFEDVYEFIEAQDHLEPGCYRWEGWYKKYKNENSRFQVAPIRQAIFRKVI